MFALPTRYDPCLAEDKDVSQQLDHAQHQLYKLRQLLKKTPVLNRTSRQKRTEAFCPADPYALAATLPSHLGWGSSLIRQSLQPKPVEIEQKANQHFDLSIGIPNSPKSSNDVSLPILPELAVSLLREKVVAPGRIWMLLRYLDSRGCGWISIDEIKQQLTSTTSSLRVCGWRQLRNLLNEGEAIFWTRANGRVWLRSLPKVAQSFHINQFHVDSVAIPLRIWLARIGTLRAHLYASFHSGRSKNGRTAPIARTTIEAITTVSPRIQRLYEETASVSQQSHFCIGPPFSSEQFKAKAWQHGRAIFKLKDSLGVQGRAGKEYIAWQLPNSYAGPHQHQKTHQRRRINKRLFDLLNKGIVGNKQDEKSRFSDKKWKEKRYFANGRQAAQAICQQNQTSTYWPRPSICKNVGIWHEMSL